MLTSEKKGAIKEDLYFLNLISLVYSLKHHEATKLRNTTEVAIIVTEAISQEKRNILVLLGARLITVKSLSFQGISEATEQWKNCYTKLNMFQMTFYQKILYMDTDLSIMKPLDSLFTSLFKKEPNQYFFGSVQDWGLSKGIFNAGLMIFEPSMAIFDHLKSLVYETEKYDSSMMEQGLLNWYFQQNNTGPGNLSWHELPERYNHQWVNKRPTQDALDASVLHFKVWKEDIQHKVYIEWRKNLIRATTFLVSHYVQLDLEFIPATQKLFLKQLENGLLGKESVKHSFTKNQTIAVYTLVAGKDVDKSYDVPRILANRERFTRKWNLDHIVQTNIDNVRFPVWQKVYDAEKYIERYDWIWFFDSDAFIMNGDISLRGLLQKYQQEADQEVDIVIANDCNGFNAGSFIVRKSNWTMNFIQKWKEMENRDDFPNAEVWREQAALVHLYNLNELQSKDHIYIVPQQDLNSYSQTYCGHSYLPGDFVVHSPGFGYHKGVESFLTTNKYHEY